MFLLGRYRYGSYLQGGACLTWGEVLVADRVPRALGEELDALVDCDLVQYFDADGPWRDLLPGLALPTWNAHSFTIGVDDQTLGRSPLERDSWSLSLGDLQEV